MGLSEDQKAMLRLLAQREQGYEDIAALMGLSVGEVREKVKDALSQLEREGTGEPRPAGPVPEGDSSSSQAAGEESPSAPPAGAASAEAAGKDEIVEPSPRSSPSSVPAPATPAAEAGQSVAGKAKRGASSPPRISLPASGGARAAIAAGVGALVVLVVVLIVSGGGGGSSDSTTAASSAGETSAESEAASSGGAKQVTKAVLSGVGGSEASGVAIFGRVKNSLALQVEAEGLTPSGSGHSYAIWLAQSPRKMVPLASTAVKADGRLGAQFEVPTEVLAYLANETFGQIVVTEVADSALQASVKKATSEKRGTPEYTGTEVLSGTVTGPIVGAAKKSGK